VREQGENIIRDQIMTDFAKTRSTVDRVSAEHKVEWKIDPASVLLGVLLGAVVVFAGLKTAKYQEIQPSDEVIVEKNAVAESGIDFEFYEVLKRDDLYPPNRHK
jgi:hypothetical protein